MSKAGSTPWRPALLLSLAIALALPGAGCSLPEGDQTSAEQVHYRFIAVRAAGDVDSMWALLHPEVKREIERWQAAESEAIKAIADSYPEEDAAAALAAMGGKERAAIKSPAARFARLVTPAPEEAPGGLQAVGARVRSSDLSEDGTRATVRTYAGDEFAYWKGDDGSWYATLPSGELERLRATRARAEANLKQVRANIANLGAASGNP